MLFAFKYYGLSIESDNGFGYSTKTMNVFKTDQDSKYYFLQFSTITMII